ncbi:MAG TPA: hypothetical protein VFH31_07100, partial [Pyrinomonadaceae bacterium]|nr:hypothetical protein [Pyrinomonadaceae bacterium]
MADELAGKLDGWFYGCDICQDVCPWNRFEETTTEPRFNPRVGNVNASLSEIDELTPETYAERFRGSAMKRAKLGGLQRNARALMKHREPDSTGGDSDRVSRVSTGSGSDRVSRVSTGSGSDRGTQI